jgi:hypothetical protein
MRMKPFQAKLVMSNFLKNALNYTLWKYAQYSNIRTLKMLNVQAKEVKNEQVC